MTEQHRFSRTELLIGSIGLELLRNSTVAVFGLGGVGSFAAEALCRAGIGHLVLVDFDDICLTNINRQLHALDSTIGRAKAVVMAERLKLINPAAEIVTCKDFYAADTCNYLLSPTYDYVVDAIDHITSKLHLITSCREQGIPIISSMGAATKTDPTQIRVADLADTHKCRMARIVRKLLRRQGIEHGVTVVFSTEEFSAQKAPPADSSTGLNRDVPDLPGEQRRPTLGSISYIPPIFGLTMAGVVVNNILRLKK